MRLVLFALVTALGLAGCKAKPDEEGRKPRSKAKRSKPVAKSDQAAIADAKLRKGSKYWANRVEGYVEDGHYYHAHVALGWVVKKFAGLPEAPRFEKALAAVESNRSRAPEGWRKTTWGMSRAAVAKIYPSIQRRGTALHLSTSLLEVPTIAVLEFEDDALSRVSLRRLDQPSATRLRALLEMKYGPAIKVDRPFRHHYRFGTFETRIHLRRTRSTPWRLYYESKRHVIAEAEVDEKKAADVLQKQLEEL